MSTGVVVNGYEIRNWHTVSILELYRARKGQERGREPGQPALEQKSKDRTQRSKSMAKLTKEQVQDLYALADKGKPVAEIAATFGITEAGVAYHLRSKAIKEKRATAKPQRKLGKKGKAAAKVDTALHPGHEAAATALRECGFSAAEIQEVIAPKAAEPVTKVTSEPPAGGEQMDDPELVVAAAPEPIADEAALELGRTRARYLHATTSRVIAVQELPTLSRSVLARQQYEAPRILESGSVVDVANPHAAAKLVENLVAELNQVPGVQAYFEWRSQGSVGQPLAH